MASREEEEDEEEELTQESVLRFLSQRGGRALNADLLERFRGFLNSPEPQRRARARQRFKEMVNAVATVKQDRGSGAKYVQLRKKYRTDGAPSVPPEAPGRRGGEEGGTAAEENEGSVASSESLPGSGGDGGVASPLSPPEAPPPLNSPEVPQPLRGGAGRRESGGGGGGSTGSFEKGGREEEEDEAAEAEGGWSDSSPPPVAAPSAPTAATPRGCRKNLRERVLGSPQPKRSGWRCRGGDSDSASLASDEGGGGGGSVALDPLEHAWMLCASDGRWEVLEGLLSCEPSLLSKRDFITGFSCLHWAAKHGRHELLATLVGFGLRHRLPVNVNARTSSGGYTALHLAAMHGHLEVVKLLVGAYDADVDVRDYSGRKASHYLSPGTAEEARLLVGALQDEADGGAANGGGRWRLSKVLPANLIPYKLSQQLHLHHGDEAEPAEGPPAAPKELTRKTSGSSGGSGRIKPRLNKIRFRTQIIHTNPSFRGEAEEEGQEEKPLKGSFKLRPKSNVFG